MSEGTIEILGQKLAYPRTWQGAFSVFAVCITVVVVAYFAKGWATPEVLDGLAGLNATTKKQESINESMLKRIEDLTLQVTTMEAKEIKGLVKKSKTNSSSTEKTKKAKAEAKKKLLEQQLAISKLRGAITSQSLLRLQKVAPVVESKPAIEQQVQHVQEVQQQQLKQQQKIQKLIR